MRISDWSSDVCSSDLLLEGGDRRVQPTRVMLQAVDEIMRILARVAMIKGECLEAREADDICVSDRLGRQAFTVEQLGGQFGLVVQIKHHRGMGDVERRDVAFGRKPLDLPAAERSEEHTSDL